MSVNKRKSLRLARSERAPIRPPSSMAFYKVSQNYYLTSNPPYCTTLYHNQAAITMITNDPIILNIYSMMSMMPTRGAPMD